MVILPILIAPQRACVVRTLGRALCHVELHVDSRTNHPHKRTYYLVMDKTGMDISLIGRKSRCKLTFFRASSSSDNPISNIATTQVPAWWTPDFAPRQTHLVQAPVHGFSPSGDRLLPARIRSVSVADIIEEESKTAAGDIKPCASCAVLLLVSADVVFHRGQPRTTRGRGSNPVKAAVVHARERLGGDKVKLAVAVSVDVEDDGAGKLVPSVVRSFLDEVRDDKELEGVPVLAVSPRTELWLRQQESEGGRVSYRRGDSNFRVRLNQSCDAMFCGVSRCCGRSKCCFACCRCKNIIIVHISCCQLSPIRCE